MNYRREKILEINIKTQEYFTENLNALKAKYDEQFEYLNGFHDSQMNFSDFIDNFIDKNIADVTIDSNANASNKDIRSLLNEKGKSHDKLFAFNKIFYELEKKYGLEDAQQWLENEYNGGFYMHDAHSSSFLPYCFSGDTKILTKEGIRRLDELVDKDIFVLNKNNGWEKATVKNFGKQPLRKLTLTRYGVEKTFLVTGNHKWFVKQNDSREIVDTDNLKPGMKIPFNTSVTWSNVEPSPFGVAHGFYIGDGDKGTHKRVNFCGDKKELLPYFTPAKVNGNDDEFVVTGIPNSFLELPNLNESVSYLYGYLAGYFAADGSIDDKGRCTISSAKRENLESVRDILCVLGMPVNEIRYQDRVSNLTNQESRIYILTISSEYLRDNFFIRPSHKEKWNLYGEKERKNRNWIVESIEHTDIQDEVYCAVAEDTHSFTLDGNILTHNCYAYDLSRLATEGLFFLNNYNNKPPKHLTTFIDDVIEFISFMSNRCSGEQLRPFASFPTTIGVAYCS